MQQYRSNKPLSGKARGCHNCLDLEKKVARLTTDRNNLQRQINDIIDDTGITEMEQALAQSRADTQKYRTRCIAADKQVAKHMDYAEVARALLDESRRESASRAEEIEDLLRENERLRQLTRVPPLAAAPRRVTAYQPAPTDVDVDRLARILVDQSNMPEYSRNNTTLEELFRLTHENRPSHLFRDEDKQKILLAAANLKNANQD